MTAALQSLREGVERRLKELGWSYSDLAREIGKTPQEINRYLKSKKGTVGLDKVDLLAKGLRCSPAELFSAPPPRESDHPLEECVRRVRDAALRPSPTLEDHFRAIDELLSDADDHAALKRIVDAASLPKPRSPRD